MKAVEPNSIGAGESFFAGKLAEQPAQSARAAKPPKPPELLWYRDVSAVLDAGDFVEGLLTENSLAAVYGPSNSGKTFFTADLCLHVAAGIPWRGREVDKGATLYCALEGGYGIKNRVAAFKREYGLGDIPFAVMTQGLDLRSEKAAPEAVGRVIIAARTVGQRSGLPVRIIVIDTLARALAGGDENSSTDMGAVLAHCDEIRQETGANVLLIHHTGKDASRGERGWSGLRAALDTSISIERSEESGVTVATVEKQRDLPKGDRYAFRLVTVELGRNRRDKPVTSCVVEHVDTPPPAKSGGKRGDGFTSAERIAFGALVAAIGEAGEKAPGSNHIPSGVRVVSVDLWRKYALMRSVSTAAKDDDQRRTCDRAMTGVLGKKAAASWNGFVWLVSGPDETGRDRTTVRSGPRSGSDQDGRAPLGASGPVRRSGGEMPDEPGDGDDDVNW